MASGFTYYGYRYLDTQLGRWLSRDPIGEEEGCNLYTFVGNAPALTFDYLGGQGIRNKTEEERQKKAEEEAKLRVPPNIKPYSGPKELYVKKDAASLEMARNYFGYYLAMEALRNTLSLVKDGDLSKQREFGGTVCAKCIACPGKSERYHVIYTGPSIGTFDGFNPMARKTHVNGKRIFLDLCPEGYFAIAGYHSHPMSSGGATNAGSGQDRRRFNKGSKKRSQNYADQEANDNILSGEQFRGPEDPEFVGGIQKALNPPVVWKVPSDKVIGAPQLPMNFPCA